MRALWLVLLVACSIPTETFIPFPCDVMTCAAGSTCQETEGVAVCVCDAGLQDNDGDGTCTENCDAFACETRESCDDSSGTAQCACSAGFQDNDNNGSCTFACSAVQCGSGESCTDASGTATCGCAAGYQDRDGDGACNPSCDFTSCGNKGCDDSSGVATCLCGPGLQDNDNNGTCTPDCSLVVCSGTNTACSAATGTATCGCAPSYADFDGDGNCTVQCGSNLVNSTATGGSATVRSIAGTNGYSVYGAYIGGSCSGHRDATGAICDNAGTTNHPMFSTDTFPRSGPRYTTGGSGEGVMVIDAGSAVTFNTVQLYQFFRVNGGTGNVGTSEVRFSVHPNTTASPPAATDAGWVPLTASFEAVPAGSQVGTRVSLPKVVSVTSQSTRYLRVEVKSTRIRAAIRNVKMFLCQ